MDNRKADNRAEGLERILSDSEAVEKQSIRCGAAVEVLASLRRQLGLVRTTFGRDQWVALYSASPDRSPPLGRFCEADSLQKRVRTQRSSL